MSKKSPLTLIIALLCLAAYVFALGWGAYRVFLNIRSNRAAAESNFYELREILASTDSRSFAGGLWQQGIRDGLNRFPAIAGVIVSSPGGDFAFEREPGGIIGWVDGSPRFSKRFGIAGEPFFSPLHIEGMRNITLHAVYHYFEYGDLLAALRQSLLIVLGALGVAFLCLILETAIEKREGSARAAEDGPPEGDGEEGIPDDFFGDAGKPEDGGDPADFGEDGPPDFEDAGPEEGDPPDFGPDSFLPEPDAEAEGPEDFGSEDGPEPEPEKPAPAQQRPAQGGTAPVNSQNDRAGAARRLAAELGDALAGGEDLSLMALHYGNPDDPDGIWYKDFVRMTAEAYSRELVFENGDRGLTVIIPGTDLDQAIARAQEFRKTLPSTFTQSLGMGISAMAGREVPADRLLLEAVHAAKKSSGDPASPIVAFKSDPEKFRAFMEGRR